MSTLNTILSAIPAIITALAGLLTAASPLIVIWINKRNRPHRRQHTRVIRKVTNEQRDDVAMAEPSGSDIATSAPPANVDSSGDLATFPTPPTSVGGGQGVISHVAQASEDIDQWTEVVWHMSRRVTFILVAAGMVMVAGAVLSAARIYQQYHSLTFAGLFSNHETDGMMAALVSHVAKMDKAGVNRDLYVVSDVVGFGCISDRDRFNEYFNHLKSIAKRAADSSSGWVYCAFQSDRMVKEVLDRQYPPEAWADTTGNERFREKVSLWFRDPVVSRVAIEHVHLRAGLVEDLKQAKGVAAMARNDFLAVIVAYNRELCRDLHESSATIHLFDGPMPMHLWVMQGRQGLVGMTDFYGASEEAGFYTNPAVEGLFFETAKTVFDSGENFEFPSTGPTTAPVTPVSPTSQP